MFLSAGAGRAFVILHPMELVWAQGMIRMSYLRTPRSSILSGVDTVTAAAAFKPPRATTIDAYTCMMSSHHLD